MGSRVLAHAFFRYYEMDFGIPASRVDDLDAPTDPYDAAHCFLPYLYCSWHDATLQKANVSAYRTPEKKPTTKCN